MKKSLRKIKLKRAFIDILGLSVGMLLVFVLSRLAFGSKGVMYPISGDSMSPTLKSGQVIFQSDKEIQRGDIITFKTDEDQTIFLQKKGKRLVKRVIGMPGDTVEINVDGIFLNGQLIQEDYIAEDSINYYIDRPFCGVQVILDDNEYFVLGDNRSDSNDSRIFGPIKASQITSNTTQEFDKTVILNAEILLGLICFSFAICYIILKLADKYEERETAKLKEEG